MAIYDFFLSRNNGRTVNNYVGHVGRLFYDGDNGVIKLSDGLTPGGLSIPYTIASDTVIGGIKAGPGVVVNSAGQLLINTAGLEFSFGDLTGTVGTYAAGHPAVGEDYALLSSVNANEDIVLAANGTGIVKVIGDFSVRAPFTNLDDTLLAAPVFRVNSVGQIVMLVPKEDPLVGALEIVGNGAGLFHPPNQTGVIVHVTGNQALPARMYIDSANSYPIIVGRRYNGSVNSLTQVLNNQVFFRIAGQASTGTSFETFGPARINWIATENQGPTNQGGKITIEVAANGTSSFGNGIAALEITATGVTTPVGFVGDGSRLTNLPQLTALSAASSANPVIANSRLDPAIITNMTLSPPAGKYLASFSSEYISTLIGSVTSTAAADLATLYSELMNLSATVSGHAPAYGSGETLGPGVYTQAGASSIAGTLTLNGSATSLFVFRCAGALTTSASATIVLTGGAVSSNVWFVSEGAISTGSNAVIKGTLLANQAAVNPGSGTSIQGRLLAVNGAIGIASAALTAPTGTTSSSLTMGSLTQFSIFAGVGALTNTGASNIALSIGTDSGTITGFEAATISGETYPSGAAQLAVINYGIYVNNVLIPDSNRTQSQTSLVSGWPMAIQTVVTVLSGQTVDVRTTVPTGGFSIGPGMSLTLIPVVI
jgi:hypothetical protein